MGSMLPYIDIDIYIYSIHGPYGLLYPLVNSHIAMENGPVEIVDVPMKNGGSFHSKMWLFTRGYPKHF